MDNRVPPVQQITLAIFNRTNVGMLVVTESRKIILANQAATDLIRAGDVLVRDVDDRLVVQDEKTDESLAEACRNFAIVDNNAQDCHSQLLSIPRAVGRAPLMAEVSPVSAIVDEIDSNLKSALIMLIDPENRKLLDIRRLSQLYKLSMAEAAVGQLVLDGLSNPQIAMQRGTLTETVKSQISNIFSKTGVDSRTGLVCLAARLMPPKELEI